MEKTIPFVRPLTNGEIDRLRKADDPTLREIVSDLVAYEKEKIDRCSGQLKRSPPLEKWTQAIIRTIEESGEKILVLLGSKRQQ